MTIDTSGKINREHEEEVKRSLKEWSKRMAEHLVKKLYPDKDYHIEWKEKE